MHSSFLDHFTTVVARMRAGSLSSCTGSGNCGGMRRFCLLPACATVAALPVVASDPGHRIVGFRCSESGIGSRVRRFPVLGFCICLGFVTCAFRFDDADVLVMVLLCAAL